VIEKWTEHHSLAPSDKCDLADEDAVLAGRVVAAGSTLMVEGEVDGRQLTAVLPSDWHDAEWRKPLKNSKIAWLNPDDEIPIMMQAEKIWFELFRIGPDFLAVQPGSTDGALFWVTHEDSIEPFGRTMGEALKKLKRSL